MPDTARRKPAVSTPFCKAYWIWPDSHNWDLHNCYALFRKEFRLSAVPSRAPLFITADQSYQLYLNGRYVCRGPARGFQNHWPYDVVDVSPHLRRGRNVIAVRAHHPGFSNFQYISQGYAGLLVAAEWKGCRLHSDPTWKCRRQTGINRQAMPVSLQLFCQEHIDLRLDDPAWMQPDFDDSAWKTKAAALVWNSMPWFSLEERGIPLLDEKVVYPEACLGKASGRCADGYLTTRDATRTRFAEGLAHDAGKGEARTIEVKRAGRGRFRSVLIDFGGIVVGSVGFKITGAHGGEVIDTLHTETIDEKTSSPHFAPDFHSRMAFGHRVVCRRGSNSHVFYHPFGFRYMVLTVRDSTSMLTIKPFLRTALYPLRQEGAFRSSDLKLGKIWDACARTLRCCSMDALVDTPWREQAQWWGDARVSSKATFFLSGDTRLFRRGIAQIAAQTTPNGLTYGMAPTMAHRCVLPDFTLIWIITLWDYYWQTGSLEPFLAHQETVRGALSYFENITDRRVGLLPYDPRYWLFLDWSDLFKKEGYSTVYNLWLLLALEKLALLYRAANQAIEVRRLGAWSARLRKALSRMTCPDGLVRDGIRFNGSPVGDRSVHSQTLAIMAGFQPEHHEARFTKVLLPYIAGRRKAANDPSCYWDNYVFEVLGEAGYGLEVIETIRKKWEAMGEYGTTWEAFHPQLGAQSFSHAWSAHPLHHLMQHLGGVRQSGSAWKTIVFQPCFVGDSAEVVLPTPQGEIRSEWKRVGAEILIKLVLPPGISATIRLPDRAPSMISGSFSGRISGNKSN